VKQKIRDSMRKSYDFSRGTRNHDAGRLKCRSSSEGEDVDDVPPLTRAQIRELKDSLKDLDDRTRFLLVSVFTPRFALYYNLSEDTYGMNEPGHATLFKRRPAAIAIRQMLGPGVQIVRCRVTRTGKLVERSVPVRVRKRSRSRKGAV
jgi:hypothetical protein